MMKKERKQYIDIARGIAMLCIIIGHMSLSDKITRIVFMFHVQIFFYITGYFFKANESWHDFLIKRIRVLIVPYAITCAAMCVLSIPSSIIHGLDPVREFFHWMYASLYGAGGAYTEPFYIKRIGAIWFLLASFWGSVIMRYALEQRPGTRMSVILISFVIGIWTKRLFWFPFSIQAGMCASLFMYIGWLLRKEAEHLKSVSPEVKTLCILAAIGTWIWCVKNFRGFYLVDNTINNGIVDIIGSLCASAVVLLISSEIEKHAKHIGHILAFAGRYSLLILCMHILELNLFPWTPLCNMLMSEGFSWNTCVIVMIALKLTWILGMTGILSRYQKTRRLFGYS